MSRPDYTSAPEADTQELPRSPSAIHTSSSRVLLLYAGPYTSDGFFVGDAIGLT